MWNRFVHLTREQMESEAFLRERRRDAMRLLLWDSWRVPLRILAADFMFPRSRLACIERNSTSKDCPYTPYLMLDIRSLTHTRSA